MSELGKILIFFGLLLAVIGLLLVVAGRAHLPIGRLPGDMFIGEKIRPYISPS